MRLHHYCTITALLLHHYYKSELQMVPTLLPRLSKRGRTLLASTSGRVEFSLIQRTRPNSEEARAKAASYHVQLWAIHFGVRAVMRSCHGSLVLGAGRGMRMATGH